MAGIENFSPKARQVLSMAQKHAERLQKPQISTEHLLIALIELEGSVASRVLRELGLETDRVSALVEKELGIGDHTGSISLSAGLQQVMPFAIEEARKKGRGTPRGRPRGWRRPADRGRECRPARPQPGAL